MRQLFLTATAITLALSSAGCAQADDISKSEIETIVKEYLLENPEIIRDALIALDEKQDREAIEAVSDELFNDPRDVVIGPKDAKVTIVEFFDYNCGFCKNSTAWVKNVMDTYPDDVRIIFKELPVLDRRTQTSRYAAKAALAAARQGQYSAVHFKLMGERGLTKERIRNIVADTGANMDKFDADMKDVALERQIEDTLILSNRIPQLTGTPFFLVNQEYVSGANVEKLEHLLNKALSS